MNCSNCGKQIAEGARFCSFCGARTEVGKQTAVKVVIDPERSLRASESTEQKQVPDHLYLGDIEAQVAADEAEQYSSNEGRAVSVDDFVPVSAQKTSKKKGKRKLIVAIAVILAAVIALSACAAVLMLVLGGGDGATSVEAYISNSGDAYVCYGKGRYVKIADQIEEAHITPDRKRAVVIGESGDVYLSDVKSGTKRTVYSFGAGADVSAICITDAMTLFAATNKDGTSGLWRYTYETSSFVRAVELSECDSVAVSDSASAAAEGISVAYSVGGDVFILTDGDSSAKKVFTQGKGSKVYVHGVSPDGEAAVWSTELDVYLYDDGEVNKISGADTSQSYSICTALDSDMLIVASSGGKVYIKQDNSKLVTATLPGALYSGKVMLDGDSLAVLKTASGKIEGVIVSVTESSDKSLFSLFLVKPDGSYRRILSDASDAVYGNAETVYYISGGELYSYDVKKNDHTRIESEVVSINSSVDGDSVYYVHHLSEGAISGTLSVYNAKDGKRNIAASVIAGSLTSHLATQRIDPSSMWYEAYQSPTTTSYTYNAIFYNGKEPRSVIRNIEK